MSEDPAPEGAPEPDQAASQPASRDWVAWAAIAVVIAVVVVIGIALSGGSPEPSPSPSVAVSQSQIPSATLSPSASADSRPSIGSGIGVDWEIAASFPGASINDITAGGPGWVAVGAAGPVGCEICPGLEEYTAKIWTSTDGRNWLEAAVPNADESSMTLVAAGPDGLVAVQLRDGDPSPAASFPVQQILLSPDGATWTAVAGTPFDSGTSIFDLTGGSTLAAVGTTGAPESNGQPAAWISADGRNWRQAAFGDVDGSMNEVAVAESGWTAVGVILEPTGDSSRPTVPVPLEWSSTIDEEWIGAQLPLTEESSGGSAQAIAATRHGLVAVGDGEYPALDPADSTIGFAAWNFTSEAGWLPAPVTQDFLEDIGGGFLVYESPDRVFALGSDCRCGTGRPGRWWTSADGLAWVQHRETPPHIDTVIPFGDGLMAAGIEDGEGAIFLSE